MIQKRKIAYQYGKSAEKIALKFCIDRGDQILCENFLVRFGEIDLILRRGRVLIFLEVKARTSEEAIHPAYSIGVGKRQRLTRAAELFLLKKNSSLSWVDEIRFDLLCVTGERVSEYREGVFFSAKE